MFEGLRIAKDTRDCTWKSPVKGKAIPGHNVAMLKNVRTRRACKAACEANTACKSVDWKPKENACSLNKVTRSEVKLGEFKNMQYIELKCEGKSDLLLPICLLAGDNVFPCICLTLCIVLYIST